MRQPSIFDDFNFLDNLNSIVKNAQTTNFDLASKLVDNLLSQKSTIETREENTPRPDISDLTSLMNFVSYLSRNQIKTSDGSYVVISQTTDVPNSDEYFPYGNFLVNKVAIKGILENLNNYALKLNNVHLKELVMDLINSASRIKDINISTTKEENIKEESPPGKEEQKEVQKSKENVKSSSPSPNNTVTFDITLPYDETNTIDMNKFEGFVIGVESLLNNQVFSQQMYRYSQSLKNLCLSALNGIRKFESVSKVSPSGGFQINPSPNVNGFISSVGDNDLSTSRLILSALEPLVYNINSILTILSTSPMIQEWIEKPRINTQRELGINLLPRIEAMLNYIDRLAAGK